MLFRNPSSSGFRQLLLSLALFAGFGFPAQGEWWKQLGLRVEENYDSNVYLQDITNLAYQDSWVSVVQPSIELGWKSKPFSFDFGYLPRISVYHSEPTENNQAHAFNLNFRGAVGQVGYEFTNALTAVNGPDVPPTYTGMGGLPSIAGFAVRDRRDALWWKQNARVTWTQGDFFVRPVYSGYVHDFRAKQSATAGYCNYVDRSNFNGGLDLGYQAFAKTWLVSGYRYGIQEQDKLFDNPVVYNNHYERALFGVEGQPYRWLKLNVLAGPSFHRFTQDVPAGFGRNHTKAYLDVALALMPTANDTFQFAVTRFEQMTSGGCSAYEDTLYKMGYAHNFGSSFELKADMRIYRGEFESPALRDDIIFTPSLQLNWKAGKGVVVGLGYLYEWTTSEISDTPGREYHRQLVSFSLSRAF